MLKSAIRTVHERAFKLACQIRDFHTSFASFTYRQFKNLQSDPP